MSVTSPTLKVPVLLDVLVDELPPLVELVLLLVLLLLLLPQAATTMARAIASAMRPIGLILLPDTESPFIRTEAATLAL
jgi:hypothetical protein